VSCGSVKASSKARQQVGERDVASAAAVAFISQGSGFGRVVVGSVAGGKEERVFEDQKGRK
jgi:hypothetical protein